MQLRTDGPEELKFSLDSLELSLREENIRLSLDFARLLSGMDAKLQPTVIMRAKERREQQSCTSYSM